MLLFPRFLRRPPPVPAPEPPPPAAVTPPRARVRAWRLYCRWLVRVADRKIARLLGAPGGRFVSRRKLTRAVAVALHPAAGELPPEYQEALVAAAHAVEPDRVRAAAGAWLGAEVRGWEGAVELIQKGGAA